MKIILNQEEIGQIVKQALTDYISQRLTVPKGTSVQINMTAEGATIDLVEGVTVSTPAKRGPRAHSAVTAEETPVKQVPDLKIVPQEEDESSDEPEVATAEEDTPPAVEVVEVTEEVKPVTAGRSLFSHLKKPSNG